MVSAITGIGTAVPLYKQHQQTAAELVVQALQLKPDERRRLKAIYRSTHIDYRHSVLPDICKRPGEYEFFPNDPNLPFPSTAARMKVYKENALAVALAAIENCLENKSNLCITHVITVSCTGMYAPGLDIEIVQTLKLSPQVKRTCINFMGCYGAFNAIKVADAICNAQHSAVVLVVSVELCTLHFQKNDSLDNIISNSIFADGAAAILIQRQPKEGKYFSLETFHCDLLPQNSQDMAWHIADSGFDIILSSYVAQAIQTGIMAFTQRLLAQSQMRISDIGFYAIHPGGYKILKACEEALGISADQNKYAYGVLRNYGNMSSATIVFVLKAIWDAVLSSHTGHKIFSCAFGPGLTLESMLLEVHS